MTTFYVLMPRWSWSLPPPAAPTSPSCSHPSSLSIAVESPSRRHLPSSCRCTVHHHQGAIASSIAFALCRPLLSSCRRAIHCRSLPSSPLPLRCRRAVHCHVHCHWVVAIALSIAVLAVKPSIAIKLLLHCPPSIASQRPLPLRCQSPLSHPLPSSRPSPLRPQSPSLVRLVVVYPLVTPTPPISEVNKRMFFLLVGSTNSTICNWWGLKYIKVLSFVRFTNICFLWG